MVCIDVTVVVILGFLSFDSFPDFHEFARREIRRWSGVEGGMSIGEGGGTQDRGRGAPRERRVGRWRESSSSASVWVCAVFEK